MTHSIRRTGVLATSFAFVLASCSLTDSDEAKAPEKSLSSLTFETIALADTGFWNGFDGTTTRSSQGATLKVRFTASYGSWSGIAVSRRSDTVTAGYLNQYSAFPGSGAGGSKQFGIWNGFSSDSALSFDAPRRVVDVQVANTTYAGLSMTKGDQFAKAFSHAGKDWFEVTFHGISAAGDTTGKVVVVLADFRTATAPGILRGWKGVDLRPLGTVSRITVSFASSDVGTYGMNTPAYVAIDDLRWED